MSMTMDDQARLNVHLAEHARLVGENHATFQRQQQQINVMVYLASGITGLLISKINDLLVGTQNFVFLLIPLPFLALSALHLRDDLKIHAIDEYIWLVLRKRGLLRPAWVKSDTGEVIIWDSTSL